MRYDPDTEQRVGAIVNIGILILVGFGLYSCFGGKSVKEKQMDCFVKEMRGQGEHMQDVVWDKCISKTRYDHKKHG